MPTARKVGKAESAEKVKVGKGKLPSDAIPDWALYASIFFGFIGMILIGIAVAKRYVQKEHICEQVAFAVKTLNMISKTTSLCYKLC